jgi:hypothetical protein
MRRASGDHDGDSSGCVDSATLFAFSPSASDTIKRNCFVPSGRFSSLTYAIWVLNTPGKPVSFSNTMSAMRCETRRRSARAASSLKDVSDSPRTTSKSWNVAAKLSAVDSASVPITR